MEGVREREKEILAHTRAKRGKLLHASKSRLRQHTTTDCTGPLLRVERRRALKERRARENARNGSLGEPRRAIRESIVVYRGSVHIRRR